MTDHRDFWNDDALQRRMDEHFSKENKNRDLQRDRDLYLLEAQFESKRADELQKERDDLSAKVAKLQSEATKLLSAIKDNKHIDTSGYLIVGIEFIDNEYDALELAMRQNVCLAEHDATVIENLRFPTMLRKMWSGREVEEWLKQEATRIRQQAQQPEDD